MKPSRETRTCPKCGKEAYVSGVYGYCNTGHGWRVFCPHCGYKNSGAFTIEA